MGASAFFGGLQIGTNFGLSPGFLSQPIPSMAGTANSPGTVELYVNKVLRQSSNVQSGPFTIENFTPLTSAGEARMVVRDVLGRETVVVQPFFTNTNLLTTGLSDWSLSLGRERYNLGIESQDYRNAFISGLYRRGMSDKLTLEGQVNGERTRQNAGLGLNSAVPFQALWQLALAQSHDTELGKGSKWLLGVDKQTLRAGFSARLVMAQSDYRELGYGPTEMPNQREQSINYRYSLDNKALVSVGSTRLDSYLSGTTQVYTASYAMRVAERGNLVFSASKVSADSSGFQLGVALVLPLDNHRGATSSLNHSDNGSDGYVSVGNALSGEVGTGWRVLAGTRGGDNLAEGGVYYQGSRAYLGADLSVIGASQTVRLNAQGALVAMDGSVFASRRLSESFALVEVLGYPDVGIGLQGALLTRTDANGQALLPHLVPFERNSIRLDPNDLPFSAELDSIEQMAVPAWRSGVKIAFPVRSGRGALLRLVLDDGEPAPAGSRIELVGDTREFFVARRGEAYVTGLQDKNSLRLKWKDQSCSFDVTLPPIKPEDIPRVGPILCKGVSR